MTLDFEPTREDYITSCFNRQGSHASKNGALVSLQRYDNFLKDRFNKTDEELLNELKKTQDSNKLYLLLNAFVQHLAKDGCTSGTISSYLMHIKGYLRSRGLKIYNEDIKQFVKIPKKQKILKKPLTREHIRQLMKFSSKRMNAFYLVCASSGLRKNEAWFLRVGDIDVNENPIRVRVRVEHTKGREERYTFITPEAYDAVKIFMENKKPDDFIFTKKRTTGIEQSADQMFSRSRDKAGLTEKQNDNYHYVVHIHAFRSFTFTEATKRFGSDYGHKLIGHHEYLDTYDQRTIEEIGEKYKLIIPDLTISNESRLEDKLEIATKEIESSQELKRKVFELEAKINRMNDSGNSV